MINLFTGDLASMSEEDVVAFLRLAESEDNRPVEGPRIDYKKEMPQDLGDAIAALANSFGGLIFIGVESPKDKQNIPSGFVRLKLPDARARVTDVILSTVNPRPIFEIGVAKLQSGHVVVVRVEVG